MKKHDFIEMKIHQANYKCMMENSLAGIYCSNLEGKIFECNDAYAKFFGFDSADEIKAKKYWNHFNTEQERRLFLKNLLEKKKLTNYEIHTKDINGKLLWLLDNCMLIKDNEESYIMGTIINITPQIELMQKFQEMQKLIKYINNAIPAALFFYDLVNKKIIFLNDQITNILGYNLSFGESMDAEEIKKLIHPADLQMLNEYHNKIKKGKKDEPYQIEYRIKDAKDSWKWIKSIDAIYSKNEYDEPNEMLSIAFDITDYKKGFKTLKKIESDFKLIYDNIPIAIIITSLDFEILNCNPFFCQLINLPKTKLLNTDFKKLIDENEFCKYQIKINELIACSIERFECELKFVTNNESFIYAKAIFATLRDIENIPTNLLIIIENITAKKREDEEKEKMKKQLSQIQRLEAIGLLAGGIAHDFNNMLTTIIGHTEIAMITINSESELYKELQGIHSCTLKAADISRQLLKFAQRHKMKFELININQIITEIVSILSRPIGEKISFNLNLPPTNFYISGDKISIEQTIMNIIINAKEAMPDGGEITVKMEKVQKVNPNHSEDNEAASKKYICLSIIDTGIGIPEEILPRIFDPFFTTKPTGSGLGLSVVYGIVNDHNGWIDVDSHPNQGTIFRIYLPLVEEKDEPIESVRKVEFHLGNNEKILIVEDEQEVLSFFFNALQQVKYNPTACKNASEAIETFEENEGDFALLLTDLNLPDKSGIKLAEEIILRKKNIPIIICSGYAQNESDLELIKKRGWYFISKPIPFMDLIAKVNMIIESSSK